MSGPHFVQRGETLTSIARQHHTTVQSLQTLNRLPDPDHLQVGQKLITSPPPVPPVVQQANRAGRTAAEARPATPPGTVKAPCPNAPATASWKRRAGGDDNVDVFYAQASGEAQRGGLVGSAKGEAGVGMAKMSHAGHMGNPYVGGSHKLEVLTAEAKASGGIVHGIGGTASAKAQMVGQEGTLFVGKDKHNPWGEGGGEYSLMQAEAKGDLLLGSDGRRAGIALGGKAGAAAATGDIKGEVNIPIPFTNWTLSARGKGGGSAGSVGLGAGAGAFKDLGTGRYHANVWGEAAALLGLKGDVDLSVGPRYTTRDRDNGP